MVLFRPIEKLTRLELGAPVPRPKLWRAAIGPALGLVVLVAILWSRFDEVLEAATLMTIEAGAALVGLHLLALVLRSEAWGLCMAVAHAPIATRLLHVTSAPRFLADTAVPTYVGAWVRIALLRRYEPGSERTMGQMITADGLLLLVEAVITVGLVLVAVFVSSIEWQWIAVFCGVVAVAATVVAYLRRRFRDREFVKAIDVLRSPRERALLTVLLVVVLAVQPVRFYLAFEAVGLEPSAADGLVAFLLTSLYGVLPIGPGPSVVAATVTLFTAATLAVVASAGLVLIATAFIAAALYSLWALPELIKRERRRSVD